MSKKNKLSGKDLFDEYYSIQYGDRWPVLREYLKEDKDSMVSIPGLKEPYYLDQSSMETADSLPVSEGMTVLGMCAAPGGKTLILAKKLRGKGKLVSNDRSPDRRLRLNKVISSSLTDEERAIIRITGFDSSSWGVYEKDIYDAILLDAPCSSERHVINDDSHLAIWSPNRPKRLAITQYAMLSSALIAAKPGGYILYSTCSINENENEKVIEKLFKRHSNEVSEISVDISYGEKRAHGMIVLPDTSAGRGPMYLCLLKKKESD